MKKKSRRKDLEMEYYPKIIKRWLTKSSIYLSYDWINKTSNRREPTTNLICIF